MVPEKLIKLKNFHKPTEIFTGGKVIPNLIRSRNSHLKVFCEKGVLKNFAKFTGKRVLELLFNTFAGLKPLTLFESCEFCKRLLPYTWMLALCACVRAIFNKVAGWGLQLYLKRDSVTAVFCCEISKSTFCYKHLWTTASENVKQNDFFLYIIDLEVKP